MDPRSLYDQYLTFRKDDLTFIYQGDLSDEDTAKIISLSDFNLGNTKEFKRLRKRISFLMAESFQNILRHKEVSASNDHSEQNSFFLTRSLNGSFYIISGNPIPREKTQALKKKLDHVNELSPEAIKKSYLQILSEGDFSNKGGAGLGLIEIARRSGKKLVFDFEKLDDQYMMFYLQIRLHQATIESKAPPLQLDFSKKVHYQFSHEGIMMLYKGDFSQETIIPVLRMIEKNLKGKIRKRTTLKRIFLTLVEMMQNISIHGLQQNGTTTGILILNRETPTTYHLSAGNFIPSEKAKALKDRLERLSSLDKNELNSYYKQGLQQGAQGDHPEKGLGMVDIARKAEEFRFETFPDENDISFFSLTIKV